MDCIIKKKSVCLALFIIMHDYKLKSNKSHCKSATIALLLESEHGSLNFSNTCCSPAVSNQKLRKNEGLKL